MLGAHDEKKKPEIESAESKTSPPSGPPERPVHDPQIEEFVRDQHRSMPGAGIEKGMQ